MSVVIKLEQVTPPHWIAPPDDNAPNYCVCNIPVRNEAPFWLPDPGDCATCDRPIRKSA